jgi:hypothetical protein
MFHKKIFLWYQITSVDYLIGYSCGFFVPGCESDMQTLKKPPKTIAAESSIYTYSPYIDNTIEDDMIERLVA